MLCAGRCSLILITLLPLTVVEVHAQRFFERDGIELRGTARIVTYGAGTCSVLEDREAAASYERKKANHGKPVDVWQLDFSVFNGSGRYLNHLIARYQIAAEWPPCTNWSGPSGTYSEQVQWGGAAGHIQESGRNVVAPGETKTATVFLVVFHEDEPHFENWSLDFEFGEAAGATRGERSDVGRQRLEPRAAATAEARGADDSPGVREGGLPHGIRGDETCSGKPAGTPCWMEVANHPRCYLWNPGLVPGATVRWSNRCSGGFAQGLGVILWTYDGKEQVGEGALVDGQRRGPWVIRYPDGREHRGPYVNGQRNGEWVIRDSDGRESRGPFVDGSMHGRWVEEFENGTAEGPYVNGEATGEWVYRYSDGRESRGPLVDGKMHGRWALQFENGHTEEGAFVDGVRQGIWVVQTADGVSGRGPYVNNVQHGQWSFRSSDGKTCTLSYVEGQSRGVCEWR